MDILKNEEIDEEIIDEDDEDQELIPLPFLQKIEFAENQNNEDDEPSPSNFDAFLVKRRKAREAQRFSINHLPNAIDELGNFIPKIGDKIYIERILTDKSDNYWLDTYLYSVIRIDTSNGNLKLFNEELKHFALSNFKTGVERGYSFKLSSGVPQKMVKKAGLKIIKESKEKVKILDKKTKLRRVYFSKVIGPHLLYKGSLFKNIKNVSAFNDDMQVEILTFSETELTVKQYNTDLIEIWNKFERN